MRIGGPFSGVGQSGFLGASAAAEAVRVGVVQAARVDCPVMILGESGVGKELVAREIHARSPRGAGPFVAINCAAISETLIESELFGHVPGAFTGAIASRRGAFEMANGGTLLLDEVSELTPVAQPKLLRAVEFGEIRPLGADNGRRVDNRIIASTNEDLGTKSSEGSFRSDLYYRLNVLEIRIPPLRDRPEDVRALAEHFLRLIARRNREACPRIAPAAMALLETHLWPGNARELRSVLERAVARYPGRTLDASCFVMEPVSHTGLQLHQLLSGDWHASRRAFERLYVESLLRRHAGNVSAAARAAGLSARGLHKILQRLGVARSSAHARADRRLATVAALRS
jgi:two-component system response regulator GlrR